MKIAIKQSRNDSKPRSPEQIEAVKEKIKYLELRQKLENRDGFSCNVCLGVPRFCLGCQVCYHWVCQDCEKNWGIVPCVGRV